jgi:pyridoxine kinase
MNRFDEEVATFPLIGSVANSVGMGFIGNQAIAAVASGLGVRTVQVQSMFSMAHGGFTGRSSVLADTAQFRRDVAFMLGQRPGLVLIGYLPKPEHVDIVSTLLRDYKGVVMVDPVIGDYKKGLFVSEQTARMIRESLIPMAQIVTPNRFEAEVLLGSGDQMSEHAYLNGIFDMGPEAVVITSFYRDAEKHRIKLLFSNGYSYHRISGPFFPIYPGHGVGDVFAATMASFIALGGSPFAAALLATALATRSVANTTGYGGATVDPVAALAKWNPLGYQVDDDRTIRFCERSNVESESIPPTAQDGARLKFAPPKHKIIYG